MSDCKLLSEGLLADRDEESEMRLRAELDQDRPYEAFQFAQSYLARKFSPKTATLVKDRLLSFLDVFVRAECAEQGAHLLVWYLDQDTYLAALNTQEKQKFMKGIGIIIANGNIKQSGSFAEIVSSTVMKFLLSVKSNAQQDEVTERDETKSLSMVIGEALCKVRNWERASNIFCVCDIEKYGNSIHKWAECGPKNEYPLHFTRATLGLLNKKRLSAASAFLQYSNIYMVDYKASYSTKDICMQNNLSSYHFSVILTEMLSLGSKISPKEKRDIYSLLLKKYKPVLEHPDPQLMVMVENICTLYHLRTPAAAQPTLGGGRNMFTPALKRHFSSK